MMFSKCKSVCALTDGSQVDGRSLEAVGRRALRCRQTSVVSSTRELRLRDVASQIATRVEALFLASCWTQAGRDLGASIAPGLDGAPAFIESPVVVDAVQTGGNRADARVALQAAHAAVRV